MATTESQLVSRVLGILRARGSGQTGNAEDIATITAILPDALAALRDSIYIADGDSVPDGAVFWVAMYVSQMVSEEFGLSLDAAKMQFAEAMLRKLEAANSEIDTLKGVYF